MAGRGSIGELGRGVGVVQNMNGSPRGIAGTSWLETARRPEVARHALRVAIVVGTILVAINYADRLIAGTLTAVDWIKMGVTYVVPYCVSTYSAVAALRGTGDAPTATK